jgi:inorganic triphosphatase YgiF
MSIPREIELKLEVPEESTGRLARSPVLKAAKGGARKPADLVSVYFDSRKHKLRARGLSLRVRRVDGHHLQTIKQDAGSAGLFTRNEWEQKVDGREPDLGAARASEPLLRTKLPRRVRPLFETRVRRTVYPIRCEDSEIELTIDKGKVHAGGRSAPLCEVELELKRGNPIALFKAARELADDIPVQLATASKADRGYSLLDGQQREAVKAASVALTPHVSCEQAFRTIARACLRQLVANRGVTLSGNAEGLHQMRVALRRLRAAISLFGGMLSDRQTQELKGRLKWIGGELGPAREFDVFLKHVVLPLRRDKPDGPGVRVLARELERERAEAFERAHAAIESSSFRKLMLDLAAWIEAGDWSLNTHGRIKTQRETPVAGFATEALDRRRKRILKRGARLKQLDSQRRHKLRIATKKLRYATEFFQEAFPGGKSKKRRRAFLESLEQLQDALGELNDIAVHESLSARMLDAKNVNGTHHSERAKKAFAAGRLSGREEARAASVLKQAQHAFRSFAKAKPYWV